MADGNSLVAVQAVKAVIVREWGGLDALRLEDVARPIPGPGEVRIAIVAAPINLGDIIVATGRYQVKPPLPFVPGGEGVGIVDMVGDGVTEFAIGDRVAAIGFRRGQLEDSAVIGTFAESAVAPVANVVKIPDGMPFRHAAVFRGNYETAWFSLVQAGRIRAGETVLALGASGGVGYATIACAKALGARVLASASTPEKRTLALDAGADAAIDANDEDWRLRVDAFAGGRGIDIISDPVGGKHSERAFRTLGLGGRHLVIGFAAGEIPSLRLNLPLMKSASLVGANYMRFSDEHPELAESNRNAMFELYGRGQLRLPPIAHAYPIDRFREGVIALANGTATGRGVIVMDDRLLDEVPA